MNLQGPIRRIYYVCFYEAIALVACSFVFVSVADTSFASAGALSLACSITAAIWNVAFNTTFEAWESRQEVKGRSIGRRVVHAVSFEAGLMLMLVPMIAWWLDVDLVYAFVTNLAMAAFFMAYTFVFNWGFDLAFGLPTSAQAK